MDTLDTVIEGGGRTEPGPSYAEALTAYLDRMNEAIAEEFAESYPRNPVPVHVIAGRGRKFDRVARVDPGSRAAVCFVERETGMIWKPAGWKGPELNFSRGTIYALPERHADVRFDPVLHLADGWR